MHLVVRISISPTHIISNVIKNSQLQKELCSLLGVSSLTSAAVINIIIKNKLVGKDLFCLIPPGTQTFTEGAQSKNSGQELETDTIDKCADLLASLGLCRYLSYTTQALLFRDDATEIQVLLHQLTIKIMPHRQAQIDCREVK